MLKINKLLADKSNYSIGREKKIEYLVIHYTANNGDTGKGNCKYFQGGNRNASAHYFVDESEVWQSVEDGDVAWHCGTSGRYYHKSCRNNNSIGIELCSEKDGKGKYYFNNETIKKAAELTKYLMKRYSIPIENIVRHYDVTHKICPAPMVENEKVWEGFKKLLEEEEVEIIKRRYTYEGKTKELEVVNVEGSNYVKVRDLLELLGKQVSYDSSSKVTKIG